MEVLTLDDATTIVQDEMDRLLVFRAAGVRPPRENSVVLGEQAMSARRTISASA